MSCETHNIVINKSDIENPEKDRVSLPMTCDDCGETSHEELHLEWEIVDENLSDCSHRHVLVNWNSIEINRSRGGDFEIKIPGHCDECGSTFKDTKTVRF